MRRRKRYALKIAVAVLLFAALVTYLFLRRMGEPAHD
jgi:hypothetical protein